MQMEVQHAVGVSAPEHAEHVGARTADSAEPVGQFIERDPRVQTVSLLRGAVLFDDYFARELAALEPLIEDGLVEMAERGCSLTPIGRLLMRNVGMCFDAYLPAHQQGEQARFSRAV